MWTAETRRTYDRKGLRYPTDVTDAEWELARPFIDVAQRGPGRQRRVDLRGVLHPGHGLPVARPAQGLAPAQHRARRLRALAV